MADVKDQEKTLTVPEADTEPKTAPAPFGGGTEEPPKKRKKLSRKARRRIIRLIILLALLGGGAYGVKHFMGGENEMQSEAITDTVGYGSITSTVEGSGITKAKNSESFSAPIAGTITQVLVSEGDQVTAGTPLFVIDSEDARTAVDKARKEVESAQKSVQNYEKQIADLRKKLEGLNLKAGYSGKLLEAVTLNPGDTISAGDKVAVLADDTRLRLTQYYSYAYEGALYVGQTVDVSIPSLMSSIPGTVEAVHMVSRITPEGTKLYSADILVDNQGALSAEMAASATVTANGETVYPYEPGKLEYYRTGDLKAEISGKVISSDLVDYLQVTEGQVLVRIDGEDSESEITELQQEMLSAQESLAQTQETLETAQKNLAACSPSATIDGTVIGLTAKSGDEVVASTAILTIADTSQLIVNATVDERNVSYVKAGMPVDLNQWDEAMGMGTVDTVSLSSTVNNGVATYPMTIALDNTEGTFQVNSYVDYNITASQNDNCLLLPLQSVRTVSTEEGDSLQVVYVQSDTEPENMVEGVIADEEIPEGYYPIEVEIGISDNYNVEIRSGVEEGMVVFTQMQMSNSWG